MHDIFISYAKEDKEIAQHIAQNIEKQGFKVWWDLEIPTGSTFDSVIEKAIKEARCVIVLWSENSVKSEWVHIEAAEGKNRNILIPVLIENVDIPFAFRRRQTLSLNNWLKNNQDSSFDRLILDIRSVINSKKTNFIHSKEESLPKKISSSTSIKGFSKYLGLAGIIILAITIFYFISTATSSKNDITNLKIGDLYEGGIIFSIDINRQSLKVCSANDLGSYMWHEAKIICEEYNEGGFTDWYLPSKEELNAMYTNLNLKGIVSFKDDWYWSSTETDGNGWEQDFAEGYQQNNGGGNESYSSVRAVRTINFNTLKVGDRHAGGIIFQLDPDGLHGTVCAEYDIGFFNWHDANKKCEDFKENEFTDWYLPSKEELNLIYENLFLNDFGDFEDEWYWSSTQTNGQAWEQDFSNGYQQNNGGGNESKSFVRAVRRY